MAAYTGVVLIPEDQDLLLNYFSDLLLDLLAPLGFSTRNEAGEKLAHHMTLNLGPCRDPADLGREVVLVADAWAVDDKVLAVRVSDMDGIKCYNETPHITVCVNPKAGGKPKHSNALKAWVPLAEPVLVVGTVREVG